MSTSIRRPSISVNLGDSGVEVAEFNAVLSVNQPPSITVKVHSAGGDAVRSIGSADMAQIVGQQQSKMFSERTPDITVSADDGDKGSFSFKGFTTSVGNTIGRDVGIVYGAVHQVAQLAELNTSIYHMEKVPDKMADKHPTGSIAARMKAVTERIVKNWVENTWYRSRLDPIVLGIHAGNAALLEIWYKILGASDESTKLEGMDALDTVRSVQESIHMYMTSSLLRGTEDFFQTIGGMGMDFQMLYIPPSDAEGSGTLAMMEGLMKKQAAAVVDESGTYIACGSSDIRPPTHVIAKGSASITPSNPAWNFSNDVSKETTQVIDAVYASYPEGLVSGGHVVNFTPPAWMPREIPTVAKDASDIKKIAGSKSPGSLDVTKFLQNVEGRALLMEQIANESLRKVMTSWLKQAYIDMALGSSVATITLPLSFKWEPGKFYKISSSGKKGGVICSGLLNKVQHNLAVKSGGMGSASTTLNFSHVEAGSFTLPGK